MPAAARLAKEKPTMARFQQQYNLVGKRFTRLLVTGRAENYRPGHSQWLCVCDCGTEKIVRQAALVSGNTRSCGCLRKEIRSQPRYNLVGKRFGRLVVTERAGDRYPGHGQWLCVCNCGTEKVVAQASLVKGSTRSCGCRRNEASGERMRERMNSPERIRAREDRQIIRANKLVAGPRAEAFARALHALGWMIVRQPGNGGGVSAKWSMDPEYGPVPEWADGSAQTSKAA